ncbi:hypothetical protein D3C71_1167850 [compost metagenome]
MHSTSIEPIGTAARTFLRRVRFAGVPMKPEADELELAMTCINAGYLRRINRGDARVDVTEAGAAYLDKLARCE